MLEGNNFEKWLLEHGVNIEMINNPLFKSQSGGIFGYLLSLAGYVNYDEREPKIKIEGNKFELQYGDEENEAISYSGSENEKKITIIVDNGQIKIQGNIINRKTKDNPNNQECKQNTFATISLTSNGYIDINSSKDALNRDYHSIYRVDRHSSFDKNGLEYTRNTSLYELRYDDERGYYTFDQMYNNEKTVDSAITFNNQGKPNYHEVMTREQYDVAYVHVERNPFIKINLDLYKLNAYEPSYEYSAYVPLDPFHLEELRVPGQILEGGSVVSKLKPQEELPIISPVINPNDIQEKIKYSTGTQEQKAALLDMAMKKDRQHFYYDPNTNAISRGR